MDDVQGGVNNSLSEPEKMLSQTDVNKIVGREKAQAAEQARREMEAQHAAEMAKYQAQSMSQGGQGGMPNMDPSAIEQNVYNRIKAEQEKAQQEAEQAHHRQTMQGVADRFKESMKKGPELFNDFKEVTSTFDAAAFPMVTYLATEMENPEAIFYELAKNPGKLADIHTIARESPEMAQGMLRRLSKSISENEEAKASHASTNPPLSRLQSSTKVGADSGKMSLKDLKNSNFLRG